jgi:hypothetical protein
MYTPLSPLASPCILPLAPRATLYTLQAFFALFPIFSKSIAKTQHVSSLITNVAFYIPLNPLSEPLVYTSPKNSHWWALISSESKGIEDRVGTFETE